MVFARYHCSHFCYSLEIKFLLLCFCHDYTFLLHQHHSLFFQCLFIDRRWFISFINPFVSIFWIRNKRRLSILILTGRNRNIKLLCLNSTNVLFGICFIMLLLCVSFECGCSQVFLHFFRSLPFYCVFVLVVTCSSSNLFSFSISFYHC